MALDLSTGIGTSTLNDSYHAGVQAAEVAMEKLQAKSADAIIVFAAPKYNHQKLLEGIASVTKNAAMVGGTTAGEVSPSGLTTNSVVVCALASKEIKFFASIGHNIAQNEDQAGRQLAMKALASAKTSKAKPATFLVFPDGLAGDGLAIVSGIKAVMGEQFEIVGGALGDEANFKHTYQYYNGKVYENAIVGLLIASANPLKTSTGVRSGWETVGDMLVCTKAKGNVVFEFDHRPALEVYREFLGPARGKKLPASGLEYPIGLIDEVARIEGIEYFQLRSPLSIDEKAGSVSFAAAIPTGKKVKITYSSRASIIRGAQKAAEQAKKTLKGKPRLVMLFSCVARKIVLGRRTNEEVRAIQTVLGKDVPIFGFYTYGEIGPIDKRTKSLAPTRWHNETVVLYVVGE